MWGVHTEAAVVGADQDRKAPGRPRSARADEAIIDAVLDMLAEGSTVEALSIEAIAGRAGVGKATIYRRWPNKESLIVDAVATVKGDTSPTLTGVLREDLIALLRPIAHAEDTRAGRIVPCLMSELRRSPELLRSWQKLSEPRREVMRSVLRRGIDSGELRADLDVEITVGLLVGPMMAHNMRIWNSNLAASELTARLVDAVLAGAAPR
jgi:AcrR family transcriptional regulator